MGPIKRFIKRIPPLYTLLRVFYNLYLRGAAAYKSYVFRVRHNRAVRDFTTLQLLTPEEAGEQRRRQFSRDIKFSILVPLYNTPTGFLKEMIESVINQTYQNWELCLADGSKKSNRRVKRICFRYERKDPRIKYQRLIKNEGISGNSNRCIEMATGDYMALLDHDDILHPAALFEAASVINEKNADFMYTDEIKFNIYPPDAFSPHYKPDFSPDNLRAHNYICHLCVFKASLLDRAGRFRSDFDGSQDHDLILRLTEHAESIVHIPKVLYYWRAHIASAASDSGDKPYTHDAGKKAIAEQLDRMTLTGTVKNSSLPNVHRVCYEITGEPLISIMIPNKDHIDDLKKCIQSIYSLSTYSNFEIIIIENNSTEEKTFAYYETLVQYKNLKVVFWDREFDYSAINNYGADFTQGEYLLLLNNDTEVISPDWMQEMLMFAQRRDVGIVGAKLYYPDDTVQHAGLILGVLEIAGHSHRHFPRVHHGYMGRLIHAQNVTAVTGACLMISKMLYVELGGLDERFKVAFNDLDLCMRVRRAGYLVVFTPFAELYHFESKSRGYEDTPEKLARFSDEGLLFKSLWGDELEKGDPYYNPNLAPDKEDFSERK